MFYTVYESSISKAYKRNRVSERGVMFNDD